MKKYRDCFAVARNDGIGHVFHIPLQNSGSKPRSAKRRICSDALERIDRTELENLCEFIERGTTLVK